MISIAKTTTISVTALVAAVINVASPAQAKTICGHYAIAFCSPDRKAAENFANGGWGTTIVTKNYEGLRAGYYCVVSGPQPQASAERDRIAAIANGVSASTYIKRACTDESNIGD